MSLPVNAPVAGRIILRAESTSASIEILVDLAGNTFFVGVEGVAGLALIACSICIAIGTIFWADVAAT